MSRLWLPQRRVSAGIHDAWANGLRVVGAVMPTGTGKTVVAADTAKVVQARAGCIMAHRRELVMQICMAYGKEGLPHNVIGPAALIKQIRTAQLDELGRQYIDPRAPWQIASVDTLLNLDPRLPFFKECEYVFIDEGHHVTRYNKWGAAWHMFNSMNPHVRGLLLTATPIRGDGLGLGSGDNNDGIIDTLIEGQTLKEAINTGYLTDYQVWCTHPSDLDLDNVSIGADGDFIAEQMRKAVGKSNAIVGDVVREYKKHAMGKLGVTFAASIEDCERFKAAFIAAGVPAEIVTAKTHPDERRRILKAFKNRQIWQLINVDLFGEGFDLPAIECVSMARPTWSFSLYTQQWGRALRLMIPDEMKLIWDTLTDDQRLEYIARSEKPFAFIFDHVGNVLRHRGPPDKERTWSTARREKRALNLDLIPQRICLACSQPFDKTELACPRCGAEIPEPIAAARNSPHTVDGDLVLYSEQLNSELRNEHKRLMRPAIIPNHLKGTAAEVVIFKNHTARQRALQQLEDTINLWAGANRQFTDRINYRRFYHIFGTDILSALIMNAEDANNLRLRIEESIYRAQAA